MQKIFLRSLLKVVFLSLCMFFGVVFSANAEGLSKKAIDSIETAFPESKIIEVEDETFNGKEVKEVELVTKDNEKYEVYISDKGHILRATREGDELPLIGGELSIGLGVRFEKEIYKGASSETEPIAFISYENGPFEIQAYGSLDALYRVYKSSSFSMAVQVSMLMGEGYDADDSDYLKGMDELHTLYYAGIEFEGDLLGVETGLEIVQDISGEHDGQEISLSFEYPWNVAGFEFRPSLSLTWISKDIVDYFYGVSSREAKSDRPVYSPDSTYEVSLELMVMKQLFDNINAVGMVEFSTFGDEIKDSPLVEKDYEFSGVLGLLYTF
ncbi:MAG: MltA-interacting protein [Desulfobacterales bacterium]|nr:MltA-interacting protein [Desulfobacterales bacterium]